MNVVSVPDELRTISASEGRGVAEFVSDNEC